MFYSLNLIDWLKGYLNQCYCTLQFLCKGWWGWQNCLPSHRCRGPTKGWQCCFLVRYRIWKKCALWDFQMTLTLSFRYNIRPNGKADTLTLHGACPVLYGTKWGGSILFMFEQLKIQRIRKYFLSSGEQVKSLGALKYCLIFPVANKRKSIGILKYCFFYWRTSENA